MLYRCGVDGFPEMTFAGGGIADGAEAHFITLVAEGIKSSIRFKVTNEFGGQCHAQGSEHLPGGGCHAGGYIFAVDEVRDIAVFIEVSRSKMSVHLPAAAVRIVVYVRIGVELGKKLTNGGRTNGESEGLIAVVPAVMIPRFEEFRHGDLGYFLTVSKDPELGLAREHFFPAQQTGFPAFAGSAVVFQDLLAKGFKRQLIFQQFVGNGLIHKGKHKHYHL